MPAVHPSYQYIPAPRSGFVGVQKLPPAHTLVIEDGRVSVECYWRLSYRRKTAMREAEAVEAFGPVLANDVGIVCATSGPIVVSFFLNAITEPYGEAGDRMGRITQQIVDYFDR